MYADALEQDGEILKQLSKGNDYAEYARRFLNIRKFAVLSRKKMKKYRMKSGNR